MAKKRSSAGRWARQTAAPDRAGRPLVAIVGRPNVGKSSLFNRLTRSRLAIVEDRPGVTRDRLYADGSAFGKPYLLIDTGGFDPQSDDPMAKSIAGQVRIALSEADVVLCLFDATTDALPADREAVALLRQTELPVLYVANKVDNRERSAMAQELYRLGLPELHEISALHGHGVGDLEEALSALLPAGEDETASEAGAHEEWGEGDAQERPDDQPDDQPERIARIAIVGRPNAGKSSLVNRLLGEQRQLVDDRPGTTVDSIDTLYEYGDRKLILIDTAGIRRKRSVERGMEGLAVIQAIRAIERSDTVVLMIDAAAGPSEQDTKIVGLALERGRAVVVALNKIDLLSGEEREQAQQAAKDLLRFMPWAPLLRVSVKSGRGVPALLDAIAEVTANHARRAGTGEVNRFFEEVLERHPPPTSGGRAVRLYFATQARSRPPTFVISTNHPDRVHFSYQRYVVNQLRERFGLHGTPIRVFYRDKNKNKNKKS